MTLKNKVAAEFFFPSFVRGKNFEKKAKKHQSYFFRGVLSSLCRSTLSESIYNTETIKLNYASMVAFSVFSSSSKTSAAL